MTDRAPAHQDKAPAGIEHTAFDDTDLAALPRTRLHEFTEIKTPGCDSAQGDEPEHDAETAEKAQIVEFVHGVAPRRVNSSERTVAAVR